MQANVAKIRATRTRLTDRLRALGYDVVPSQANFVWATHPQGGHAAISQRLKERKVLVRLMKFPGAFGTSDAAPYDGLRISVGTDEEIDRFLEVLGE
jgi:histidinol-phosphate aminotransferase